MREPARVLCKCCYHRNPSWDGHAYREAEVCQLHLVGRFGTTGVNPLLAQTSWPNSGKTQSTRVTR